MRNLVAILMLLLISATASAAPATFKLDRAQVKFDLPENWQSAPGLFGMPLVLLGPETPGVRRAVLTVTPTGIPVSFDTDALKKDARGYRPGREAWLKKMGGRAIAYFPYESKSWPGTSEVHAIGYRYELGGAELVERTYYVVCKKNLFHLKTLLPASQEARYASEASHIAESFQCE